MLAICCMAAGPTSRRGTAPQGSAGAEGDAPPGRGVPLSLAEERARRITNLRYDLHFSIPAALSQGVEGEATIRFTLDDAARPVALDFSEPGALRTRINGHSVTLLAANDHVLLPAAALKKGSNEVTISFVAGNGPLNRNPEFMYTLFVPARARQAFPCFDQPDLKARYTLRLDIPSGWRALSNGEETARDEKNGRTVIRYAETAPLPTYLFAFAAGRFQIETAERGGRRFRMFHRETDAAKVARNREAVFDLHAAALEWLERYTGIEYQIGRAHV